MGDEIVSIKKSTFDFLMEELEATHKLFDSVGVQRESVDGSELTVSQRAFIYIKTSEMFIAEVKEILSGKAKRSPTAH